MPKRVCPFDGCFLPQTKIHVGEKQVNSGVFSDQRMRNVYDRTLNLLKEGARTFNNKLNTSGEIDSVELSSPRYTLPCKIKSMSNLKQMMLTDKLRLKSGNKIANDAQIDLCRCGKFIDRLGMNTCYYCDQTLCSSCQSTCAKCTELFCQNCSLPIYNCEEEIMCLNCYR